VQRRRRRGPSSRMLSWRTQKLWMIHVKPDVSDPADSGPGLAFSIDQPLVLHMAFLVGVL
jgi:hypothetical protein